MVTRPGSSVVVPRAVAGILVLAAAATLAAFPQDPAADALSDPLDLFDSGAPGVLTMQLPLEDRVPCNPLTRACFDIRLELFVAEPRSYDRYVDPRARRRLAVLRRYLFDQLDVSFLPLSCEPVESAAAFEANLDDYLLLPLVSLREAVRSGLDRDRLPRFETDPVNLVPANRFTASLRRAADLGSYVPDRNPCWSAWRTFLVKHDWLLTVDLAEAAALQTAFALCPYNRMLRPSCLADGAATDAEVAARMREAAALAAPPQ